MRVHSIPLAELSDGHSPSAARARSWCELLECGNVLYFPKTPVPIPDADLQFLLNLHQSGSRFHKNIAYKPTADALSGIDHASGEDFAHLHEIMSRYSAAVTSFLAGCLTPYNQHWQLDYASFRPIEEQNRDLPLHSRNDLLHCDAFPTRPTRGARILRFFHNIHPTRTRDWIIGEPFPSVIGTFLRASSNNAAPAAHGHSLPLPHPESPSMSAFKCAACRFGLGAILPSLKCTPYDLFMIRLHNTMKEDAEFQRTCPREDIHFAPGSSWMVYTETVPHAVLAGQFALEQTFLIDREAMVNPETAPVAVLEKLAGARLTYPLPRRRIPLRVSI
jgi:3-deoxy-D-manno-oct-2-ulosonic acid (Kdo) hydroxylase